MKDGEEPTYVIVHGGPATGKTINAAALMDLYHCDAVIDWGSRADFHSTLQYDRVLILANEVPLRAMKTAREKIVVKGITIPVEVAAKELGDRWVSPIPNYRAVATPSKRSGTSGHLVVVDVETTGLHPDRCGVVEIGAVLLDLATLETVAEFSTPVRVCYWHEWTAEAEAVHGTPRTVAEDPTRPEEGAALLMLMQWLSSEIGGERVILAGMNPGFDLAFLRAVAERTEPTTPSALRSHISHRTVDLHTLALRAAMENDPGADLSMLHADAIYEMLGMEAEPWPHRALTGARMEAEAIALLLA